MGEVTIKGEYHSSRGDLEQEIELVKEGVDHLILEGESEASVPESIGDTWFWATMNLFFWLFGDIWTNHRILVELAEDQGADIETTRQKDTDLYTNAPLPVRVLTIGLSCLLVGVGIVIGIQMEPYRSLLWGGSTAFLGIVAPVLIFRLYNMFLNKSDDKNRDQIISDKISEAYDEEDRILVVVGDSHKDNIKGKLPDNVDAEMKTPVYGKYSWPSIREFSSPFIRGLLAFVSLYFLVLIVASKLISYIPAIA